MEDYLEDILETIKPDTRVVVNLDSATVFDFTTSTPITRQDSCGVHEAAVWMKTIEQLKCEGELPVHEVHEAGDHITVTLKLFRNGFLENFATLAREISQADFYDKLEIVEVE